MTRKRFLTSAGAFAFGFFLLALIVSACIAAWGAIVKLVEGWF